jgi:hypothetical protein
MIRVEAKLSAWKRIKGLIVALVVVGGVALIPASSATAHVHGITPLNCAGIGQCRREPDEQHASRRGDRERPHPE